MTQYMFLIVTKKNLLAVKSRTFLEIRNLRPLSNETLKLVTNVKGILTN